MRGTPGAACPSLIEARFIPAYAGNTAARQYAAYRSPVHPAYAGNTANGSRPSRAPAVHPRVCEEHSSGHLKNQFQIGSSPRVRGTHIPHDKQCVIHRFIPACAGNTALVPHQRRTPPVHPRVCGEHACIPAARTTYSGSSPRMRGTLPGYRNLGHRHRFIPAYAGNTCAVTQSGWFVAVHPRVCGEHLPPSILHCIECGSSPRMRGTRRHEQQMPGVVRFIPAYAGNT